MKQLTDEEYIAKKGLHCIDAECGGAVRLDTKNLEDDSFITECHCEKCWRVWREVYQLTGYMID